MRSPLDRPSFNRTLFFPRRDANPPPPGAEDRIVEVPGARLHLRLHRAPGATATVLLFHGNGEVVAGYDDQAVAFAEAGAALAVCEYRGYGRSDGTPSLRALSEDAGPVAEAVVKAAPGPVIVLGRSLGGAAAHQLYARPPAGVAAVILSSAFFDLDRLVVSRGIPAESLSPKDRATFDPALKLAAGHLPLLVLHGDQDTLVLTEEGRRAHLAAGGADKTLVLLAGRKHNDVTRSSEYWRAIQAFVARVAPPGRT